MPPPATVSALPRLRPTPPPDPPPPCPTPERENPMPPFKPRLDDRGQTAIEYLGILAVVAAIIVVLLATDFGTAIVNAINAQIDKVTGAG
ncbi:hypothetical protein GCM10023347_32730 [Streptomyces chumphonensis]